MAAIAAAMLSKLLNATLPTFTAGAPTAFTALGATAMYMRLNSTLSVPATEGTQITNGTGYATNGLTMGASSASAAGSNVTLPSSTLSWTSSGSNFLQIESLDITDSAQLWTWFGPFTGQPIAVANGNTFQVAANAVTVSLT